MKLRNLKREPIRQNRQIAVLLTMPDGAAGIAFTLRQMAYIARQYRCNPDMRRFAEDLIRNTESKNALAEARAIFLFVRDNIRYTQDVRDTETLKTPDATLYSGMGDCDDMSLLVSTLLESVGYTTRFVAVGTIDAAAFDHVYCEVQILGNWIALETTEYWPMGQAPSPVFCELIVNV